MGTAESIGRFNGELLLHRYLGGEPRCLRWSCRFNKAVSCSFVVHVNRDGLLAHFAALDLKGAQDWKELCLSYDLLLGSSPSEPVHHPFGILGSKKLRLAGVALGYDGAISGLKAGAAFA